MSKKSENKAKIVVTKMAKTVTVTPKTELIKKVEKRNGKVVAFDIDHITTAISKAMLAANEGSSEEAAMVANMVLADLVRISKKHPNFTPTVEGIQNSVEKELMLSEYVATAKSYILYRAERTKVR